MLCERKNIESVNSYQYIRSYLVDLSIQELIELAKDYGNEVSKSSSLNRNWRLTLHAVDNIPSQNIRVINQKQDLVK